MHHEVDKGQELLKFTEFICLFGVFLDVEPAFADIFEGDFDDLGKLSNPALLTGVMSDVGDGLCLLLLELVYSAVEKVILDVEDLVVPQKHVALSSDFDHSSNCFFFDVERLEAEVRETLGEVMLRNWYHTMHGCNLLWRLLWKIEIWWNHTILLFLWRLKSLVHDDLVHGPGEILVDLVHDTGRINVGSRLEIS